MNKYAKVKIHRGFVFPSGAVVATVAGGNLSVQRVLARTSDLRHVRGGWL